MTIAYYNENDPKASAWLCELIKQGHIAPGVVDTRSIEDVRPSELTGFTQCHFFAGIGGWSLALRMAGWPDDKPVWTGSCPCQPFSAAGKRAGLTDERHLWPHFYWLIQNCRPGTVFGEQVASKDGLGWFDVVQADLENSEYTSAGVDLCAAGFGAPHIRQRLFWVADSNDAGSQRREGMSKRTDQCATGQIGVVSGLAYPECKQREERVSRPGESYKEKRSRETVESTGLCLSDGLAHTKHAGHSKPKADETDQRREGAPTELPERSDFDAPKQSATSPTNGFWRDVDWLFSRDGKWRPVEPGTFPLADGVPARVVRVRGYGNAIVPQVAAGFIQSYMGAL